MKYSEQSLAAYVLADKRRDAGDDEVAEILSASAYTIDTLHNFLARLAFACLERDRKKREGAVTLTLMEMDAHDMSTAHMPMRPDRVRASG